MTARPQTPETMMSTLHSLPNAGTSRQTILCLHCSGGSGRQWRALTSPLTAHFDVRAPDLIGYLNSGGWPTGARVSLDDEAERLLALLVDTDEPVHLLGHSYGGAVALQMALRWPERIASLTLYEPVRFGLLSATMGTGRRRSSPGRRGAPSDHDAGQSLRARRALRAAAGGRRNVRGVLGRSRLLGGDG